MATDDGDMMTDIIMRATNPMEGGEPNFLMFRRSLHAAAPPDVRMKGTEMDNIHRYRANSPEHIVEAVLNFINSNVNEEKHEFNNYTDAELRDVLWGMMIQHGVCTEFAKGYYLRKMCQRLQKNIGALDRLMTIMRSTEFMILSGTKVERTRKAAHYERVNGIRDARAADLLELEAITILPRGITFNKSHPAVMVLPKSGWMRARIRSLMTYCTDVHNWHKRSYMFVCDKCKSEHHTRNEARRCCIRTKRSSIRKKKEGMA